MRDLDDVTVAVTSILPLVMIVLAALSSFVITWSVL